MNYDVRISKKAQAFLDKLPRGAAMRIIAKLEQVCMNPFRFLQHFEGHYYKLRIGDYRALVDVDFHRKDIWVRIIDKRGRIYSRKV